MKINLIAVGKKMPDWISHGIEHYKKQLPKHYNFTITAIESQNRKSISPENTKNLEEKLILEVARMIKIGILQQNSFDDVDTYCSPEKQFKLMKLQVDFYNQGQQALKDGASLADIRAMGVISLLLKARMDVKDDEMDKLDKLSTDMTEQFKTVTGVKVQN